MEESGTAFVTMDDVVAVCRRDPEVKLKLENQALKRERDELRLKLKGMLHPDKSEAAAPGEYGRLHGGDNP